MSSVDIARLELRGSERRTRVDRVAVEEPLEIRLQSGELPRGWR